MKKRFLFIIAAMFAVTHCFSQTVIQKKAVTKTPTVVLNPVTHQNVSTKPPAATNTTQGNPNQNSNNKTDSAGATLLDAYFSLNTATATNAGMHWSCTVFDQNNKQVASFKDESNSDAYPAGSETPAITMKSDNTEVFGNFSKGGRLHISITPYGNDTWEINAFNLTLDFLNPKFAQTLTWKGITLSPDKQNIDLSFSDKVNNPVTGYDIKANKKL